MAIVSVLASVGMAVGPPLVYLDQLVSIVRRRDSTGFSMDVCGVLLVANIIRVFFWFGERFETALLVQSLLMIAFQLVLLQACIKYRRSLPDSSRVSQGAATDEQEGQGATGTATAASRRIRARSMLSLFSPSGKTSARPLDIWQWPSYGTYIEFLAALIVLNTLLYLLLGGFRTYVDTIGLIALGLESTLISNWQRKSLTGFRLTVLTGWLFGDAFKTIYFFVQEGNSWQFKATACFQLSIDLLIVGQAFLYRHNLAADLQPVADIDEEEQLSPIDPNGARESHEAERT